MGRTYKLHPERPQAGNRSCNLLSKRRQLQLLSHSATYLSVIFLLIVFPTTPPQVPTSATDQQIRTGTAATSASQLQTHRECVGVRTAWSCRRTSRHVWRTLPTSPPRCNAEPTPSLVATANVSRTATDATVLTTVMTTVTKPTVKLTVIRLPHLNPLELKLLGFCSGNVIQSDLYLLVS